MSTKQFKDNFSKQSDLYVKYRPLYPTELYAFLASLTPEHTLVWDCGTGNGQAATGLAAFYDTVIATDPSEAQIKNCLPHDKVTYLVEKAEHSSLASNSADLLTIANALHWFDFDVFYEEVRRVLKPGGVIAAWAYGVPTISSEIDLIVNHLHDVTLHDYWVAENRLVEQGYTTIPFPFEPIICPDFVYQKPMNLHDLIAYLNTWSATQRFLEQHHFNPADQLFDALSEVWGDAEMGKVVTWKLVLKVGRISETFYAKSV